MNCKLIEQKEDANDCDDDKCHYMDVYGRSNKDYTLVLE